MALLIKYLVDWTSKSQNYFLVSVQSIYLCIFIGGACSNTLSGVTTPYNKGHRRNIKSHGLKCMVLFCTTPYIASLIINKMQNLHLAAMFSHLTIIFLNKLMVYGVVQQVYGVVSPDSVSNRPITLLLLLNTEAWKWHFGGNSVWNFIWNYVQINLWSMTSEVISYEISYEVTFRRKFQR